MIRVFDFLFDRIWPLAYGPRDKKDVDSPIWVLPAKPDVGVVACALAELNRMIVSESERFRIVESKLQGIVFTAPVAVAVVTGTVTVSAAGMANDFPMWGICAIGGLGGYTAIQLFRALIAAINGLSRRGYPVRQVAAIIPLMNEDEHQYNIRSCKELADILLGHQHITNEKVTQLGLGHTAVLNAVVALVLLVLTLGSGLVWKSMASLRAERQSQAVTQSE